jgi:hypothetical protein
VCVCVCVCVYARAYLLVQIIINFICSLFESTDKKNRDGVFGIHVGYRPDVIGSNLVTITEFFYTPNKKRPHLKSTEV